MAQQMGYGAGYGYYGGYYGQTGIPGQPGHAGSDPNAQGGIWDPAAAQAYYQNAGWGDYYSAFEALANCVTCVLTCRPTTTRLGRPLDITTSPVSYITYYNLFL